MAAEAGNGRPFVGRVEAVEALHRRFEDARAGHGGVTFLVGDTGVGKSILVDGLVGDIRSRGIRVLEGRAPPLDAPPPFALIRSALESGRSFGDDKGPVVPSAPGPEGFLIGFAPRMDDAARLVPGPHRGAAPRRARGGGRPRRCDPGPALDRDRRAVPRVHATRPDRPRARGPPPGGRTVARGDRAARPPAAEPPALDPRHGAPVPGRSPRRDAPVSRGSKRRPTPRSDRPASAHLERGRGVPARVANPAASSRRRRSPAGTPRPAGTRSCSNSSNGGCSAPGTPAPRDRRDRSRAPGGPALPSLDEEEQRVVAVAAVLGSEFPFSLLLRASGEEEERLAEALDRLVGRGLLFERPGELLAFPGRPGPDRGLRPPHREPPPAAPPPRGRGPRGRRQRGPHDDLRARAPLLPRQGRREVDPVQPRGRRGRGPVVLSRGRPRAPRTRAREPPAPAAGRLGRRDRDRDRARAADRPPGGAQAGGDAPSRAPRSPRAPPVASRRTSSRSSTSTSPASSPTRASGGRPRRRAGPCSTRSTSPANRGRR